MATIFEISSLAEMERKAAMVTSQLARISRRKIWCHCGVTTFGYRKIDGLCMVAAGAENTAIASENSHEEQHTSEITQERDHPGFDEVQDRDTAMQEGDSGELLTSLI